MKSSSKVAAATKQRPLQNPRGSSDTVDTVIDHIMAGLRQGRLVPGQRLFEATISEELVVGRGPVREALRILAGRDVIDLVPNRGAWVKRLNRDELRDMIDVLVTVSEGCIARTIDRCSVKKRTDALAPLIKQLSARIASDDYRGLLRLVNDYHRTLARLTGNQQIANLWDSLNIDHYHGSLATEVRVANWKLYVGSYQTIHRAIVAGDTARAQQLLRQHGDRLTSALATAGPAIYR
jgi:DNA-binding GntR family transcriptional regulator